MTRPAPWIVEVTSEEPEGMRHWSVTEIADMAEQYGEDSDELAQALGPTPGYRAVQIYGPYTERQAQKLAERLNLPDARKRLRIELVIPMQLHRLIDPTGIDTEGARRG